MHFNERIMIKNQGSIMKYKVDEVSRIIEMAWEDRTPFEAIALQFDLLEPEVIKFMRQQLQAKSFKIWRKRVNGRVTKHTKLRGNNVTRAYCPTQYKPR